MLWLRFRVGPDLQIGIFDEGGSLKTEFDDVSDTDNLENTDAVGVEKLLLISIQWIDTINAATMAKSTQGVFSFVGPNQCRKYGAEITMEHFYSFQNVEQRSAEYTQYLINVKQLSFHQGLQLK